MGRTVRQICKSAAMKRRLYGNEAVPGDDFAEVFLPILQSIFLEFISQRAFTQLSATRQSEAYTAVENVRIFNTEDAQIAITLPEEISTLYEIWSEDETMVRPPNNHVVVAIAGATPAVYLYEAEIGGWSRLTSLGENDYCPLSDFNPDGLASFLAVRAVEFGGQVDPNTVAVSKVFRSSLVNTFNRAVDTDQPRFKDYR